jgi:hypothetical protein
MLDLYFYNKKYFNSIELNYKKKNINNLFLNSKFIIYISYNNDFILKNKIINYNIYSLILKKNYIKSLFDISCFSFLSNKILCIFINDVLFFFNIIQLLEKKEFFYSYKNSLSNIIINYNILFEYKKYNNNYIYIQFFIKKIKIKIIILLFLFLFSLIKYIK